MKYLSACLCFCNSASYLEEWLAFYESLGVEYFYLYNNESTDDFDPVIRPYLESGKARCINFSGRGQQAAIYDHCLEAARGETKWLSFCDDDEFLFPVKDVPLPAALAAYEEFGGVAVCWMLYGSSGHQKRPEGLAIENYTRRMAVPDHHVKCIVDPARVVKTKAVGHEFETVPGHLIVDEHGQPAEGPQRARPSADILRINHYLTKSIEEMVERRSRIQVNTGMISNLSLEKWKELEAGWNAVEDAIATRYKDRIVEQMRSVD